MDLIQSWAEYTEITMPTHVMSVNDASNIMAESDANFRLLSTAYQKFCVDVNRKISIAANNGLASICVKIRDVRTRRVLKEDLDGQGFRTTNYGDQLLIDWS